MAAEIVEATDGIATRMIEKVRTEYPEIPSYSEQAVTDILAIRQEIQLAATRIINKCSSDREERIGRVRKALQLDLNVAAAFLLDMVDEPGRTHGGDPVALEDDRYRRRLAVYVVHIRRALRPRGLETALTTMRPRGYVISPPDAIRIRMLWGESLSSR
ncbi:hypothetical protein [Sphingomonas sp. dw_22]|uniref:hypothetical protein n=1 Tax=Sphingomonas sp. dw_22 TaxID=2721175 RepID=UPI001BD6322F|nr:hypothetical protein [Sphingomonas sp. dw_22]